MKSLTFNGKVLFMINLLRRFFAKESLVGAAYLFGSSRRGRVRPESDVDIGVWVRPHWPPADYGPLQIRLNAELSALLNREADVVILNTAPLPLRFEVYRTGTCLWESSKKPSRAFRLHSLIEYFDLQPLFAAIERRSLSRHLLKHG